MAPVDAFRISLVVGVLTVSCLVMGFTLVGNHYDSKWAKVAAERNARAANLKHATFQLRCEQLGGSYFPVERTMLCVKPAAVLDMGEM